MNHCGTQRLETERLILRRYEQKDAGAMYRNWATDAEVTKYLTWPVHSSQEVTQQLLNEWINSYEDEKYYHWTITFKDKEEEVIGDISVVNLNEAVSKAEIGYCISRKWWHQGITSEALQAVLDFLFDVVEVNRVQARHDPRNVNSGKVMKHCGMKYEGTLRDYDRNNQGICDTSYYALLKKER